MLTTTLFLLGALLSAEPANSSAEPVPELTLEYRLGEEFGYGQPWRPVKSELLVAVRAPYEFRVLLDGDAMWSEAGAFSPTALHWFGAQPQASQEGAVTAHLLASETTTLRVGVRTLVSENGWPQVASASTRLRVVDAPLRARSSAHSESGGDDPAAVMAPPGSVKKRAGPLAVGPAGACAQIQNLTASLVNTGIPDPACGVGVLFLVNVLGTVRCPSGLSKVLVRDNFGTEYDYDDFVPPKPPIPVCTSDPFVIRLDIAEICAVGIEYFDGDVWEFEVQCCNGCSRTVVMVVTIV